MESTFIKTHIQAAIMASNNGRYYNICIHENINKTHNSLSLQLYSKGKYGNNKKAASHDSIHTGN